MAGGRGQQKVVGSSAQVVSADHPPTGRGHQQGGEGWVIKEKTRPGGDRTPEAQLPTSGHPAIRAPTLRPRDTQAGKRDSRTVSRRQGQGAGDQYLGGAGTNPAG